MAYRDPEGHGRWHRLWPRDAADWGLIVAALAGLLLSLMSALGLSGAEFGALVWVFGPLLALHGSSPVFTFTAAAFYLARRGRAIGDDRRWLWAGLVMTVPLWLLAGLPVSVRGLGDVTVFLVPWNLLAAGVMAVGPWRTLRER